MPERLRSKPFVLLLHSISASDIAIEVMRRVVYPRQVLSRLRWTEGESLDDAVIWYIHRGAPGDVLKITGRDIKGLGRGFFNTAEATIPYHRILRIDSKGRTLFEKDDRAKGVA